MISLLILLEQKNHGLVVLPGKLNGQERAASQLSPDREDRRPVRVANIPFGSLRIILRRRFDQIVAMINRPVFRLAALRTPASVWYAAPDIPIERGPVSGIAPGARVIMYRVCDADGCFNSDSVQAVQQAITDGVNVINFSIGGGAQPYADPVELAFLDATNAGISVNASAGNDGPGAATAEHGGPWTTTGAGNT